MMKTLIGHLRNLENGMVRRLVSLSGILILLGCQAPLSGQAANRSTTKHRGTPGFSATTGGYRVGFSARNGAITVTPTGNGAHLAIREIGAGKKADLLYDVTSVRRSGSAYTLSGKASWASFSCKLTLDPTVAGLLHLTLSLKPVRTSPQPRFVHPDVQLMGAPSSTLKQYDPAPPIAGTSVYLSNVPLDSSILYLENLTTLGPFFDRSQSGASQANFPYPRAGGKGSLVGLGGSYFGYPPPISSLDNLPRNRSTLLLDTYLYLLPGVPATETAMSDTYLKLLGGVYSALPRPSIPSADWHTLAATSARDLANPSNLVTVDGKRFLVSYVSDT
ncbi:MAG: hypothetical protein M3Z66_15065, partial [Chloroflexota bacterium]|nr:hypothetical protein [Chloroflexota bacterium]